MFISSLQLVQLVGRLGLAGSESCGQAKLGVDTLDAVNSVKVLNAGNLEAGSGTLAGSDRRVGEEVFPDLAVVSFNLSDMDLNNVRGTSESRTWR